ncbi:MAG: PilZ domain-containing protein [Deltaproteobacteria bacterium]|nr:PilZ domain-containing protein [Deltaproteobacteria bacterium]
MTARAAREGLAQGLQLLQSPGLPPQFLDAAEPIARAMGSLMTAERSDGAVPSIKPHAEVALSALREALGRLQAIDTTHPAAEQAMAAVAGALGSVHALSRLEAPAPQQPQYQPPQQPQYQPAQFQPPPQQPQYQPPQQPQFQPPPAAPQYQPPPAAPQYQPPPAAPQYQPPPAAPQYQPPPAAPQFQAPPAPQFQAPPAPQFQAPPAPQFQAPPAAPQFHPHAAPAPHGAPSPGGGIYSPSQHPPAAAESMRTPPGMVDAELGAHSPSNFYKTLSGNDIVEHGGIFVATYNVPKMNQRVQLRVHLPGGYHFDAAGIVRWTRDAADNPDAPPGFGAQFQGITPEQRQLIMRYVRNREPLFYDDL